jgi:hypothetical protein
MAWASAQILSSPDAGERSRDVPAERQRVSRLLARDAAQLTYADEL